MYSISSPFFLSADARASWTLRISALLNTMLSGRLRGKRWQSETKLRQQKCISGWAAATRWQCTVHRSGVGILSRFHSHIHFALPTHMPHMTGCVSEQMAHLEPYFIIAYQKDLCIHIGTLGNTSIAILPHFPPRSYCCYLPWNKIIPYTTPLVAVCSAFTLLCCDTYNTS